MGEFPLPARGRVAVAAPGTGAQNWAGASSAALDDGRLGRRRLPRARRRRATSPPRSWPGRTTARSSTTVATLDKVRFGAMSMERPALVRTETGRWRLYVCSATPNSKHWWIDLLEADDPAGFADAEARAVFPGDERMGVKDPVVRYADGVWQAWICCHPLDEPGRGGPDDDRVRHERRRRRRGTWHGTALAARPGRVGRAWRAGDAPSCPTAAPPTTGARRRRRTGSSARAWPAPPERRAGSSRRTTARRRTSATSTSCRFRAAAIASTTRRRSPTRATSCAPS